MFRSLRLASIAPPSIAAPCIAALALALCAVLVVDSRAHACSCIAQDAADAFANAASVFEARVVSIEPESEMQLVVRLRVVRTWKGADAEEVTVYTASQGPACGFGFEANHSYLVYTHAQEGREMVSLCSNTKAIESAEAELAELGPGATPVDPGVGLGATPAEGEPPVPERDAPPAAGGCASCSAAGGPVTGLGILIALGLVFVRRRR